MGQHVKNLPAMQETQEMGVLSLGQEDRRPPPTPPQRRKWQPAPVFLPGEPHGQRGAWQATVHGVAKESDTTEQLNTHTTTKDTACFNEDPAQPNTFKEIK